MFFLMIVNVSLIIQGGVKINFIFLLFLPSTLLIHLYIAGLSYSPIWFSSILLLTIIVNFAWPLHNQIHKVTLGGMGALVSQVHDTLY